MPWEFPQDYESLFAGDSVDYRNSSGIISGGGYSLNMHNRDNFQYGLYYQNVGKSTLLVYHSDFYTERKLTRMLS